MEIIFDRQRLIEILKKIDNELDNAAKLYLIGGSASCIAYHAKSGTKDIDTWKQDKEIEQAYKKVIKKFPHLKIHISPAQVQIHSDKMLKRFKKYQKIIFKNLCLFIPEAEDLFLMKAQRANEKDITDLKQLSTKVKLNLKSIEKRFQQELLPLNPGSDEAIINNFLICIDEVFGTSEAEKLEKELL